jgi:hypothetical protein
MSPQDSVRDRLSGCPDADYCIGAGGHHPAVLEDRDRVYRALVQTQNLPGDIVTKRPADRGRVKASGQRCRAVGGDGNGADRPTMPAQLGIGGDASSCRRDEHGTI